MRNITYYKIISKLPFSSQSSPTTEFAIFWSGQTNHRELQILTWTCYKKLNRSYLIFLRYNLQVDMLEGISKESFCLVEVQLRSSTCCLTALCGLLFQCNQSVWFIRPAHLTMYMATPFVLLLLSTGHIQIGILTKVQDNFFLDLPYDH